MIVNNITLNNTYLTKWSQNKVPVFLSEKNISNDTFETSRKKIRIKVFSPFSETYCESPVYIDLKKAQQFTLKNSDKHEDNLVLDYNPLYTGFLRDKRTNKPIEVSILKSKQEHYGGFCAYHFMSKDLQQEYGYVEIYKPDRMTDVGSELTRDYPEYGIVGDRIEVLYLKNYDDKNIGGVGKLADKVCVDYCTELGIEPNIVSFADLNSHAAHYKRGKRFITPDKNTKEWKFLNKKYGNTNPNEIMEDLMKISEKTGEKIDLKNWEYLVMYLPKDLAEKYKNSNNISREILQA